MRPTVIIKIPWDRSKTHHPWIHWNEVEEPATKIAPGSVVDIQDKKGQWVGRGFFNGHARIMVRVLTTNDEAVDGNFLCDKITQAIALRAQLPLWTQTNAVRLVNSEGDGLSGLIIDRFNDVCVIEYKAAGMYRFHREITDFLQQRFPQDKVVTVCDESTLKQESFIFKHASHPIETEIHENGLRFQVTAGGGHKTGFFLDQRDNRAHFAGMVGATNMLDLCAYTGGFSLNVAAKKRATEVTAVDHDPEAVARIVANGKRNQLQLNAVAADVFAFLKEAAAAGKTWGAVVLDPWRMTKSKNLLPQAERTYLELNRLAMRCTAPGGLLLTCSCTGNLSEEAFVRVVSGAAQEEKRYAQVIRISGAAEDHPYLLSAPEGRYLKALWARVL